ncbi:alpha/beta hydrolase [Fusobacterium simiae]|uniref:Alpha/beta hydrolase n=1 Tax=Fusobacterium simiae TaxID=855 RepID=A0ABT4DJT8_FUSSI|nr:alpha/beta hydrolase [Fusobacterium simiae]MCY7008862.1 alpha/beta hydrolase [Fusobacterium simiae]
MFGKKLLLGVILGITVIGGSAMAKIPEIKQVKDTSIKLVQEWDKIFPESNKVEHTKVMFKNRYGITLVGDLYVPKNIGNQKLAAIAISGPFGAVKEQSSGLYAQTLAERGFVTLAFDGSYTGESGGYPRNVPSPEINTEDFSAAVDFLGTQSFVDRDKIGILGICGWGGFALNAAISDTRIKAVATSTMYDITRTAAKGYNDSVDANARYNMKKQINEARWKAVENNYADLLPANNLRKEQFTEETPQFVKEYSDYYTTKRGYHPRAVNSNPNGSWTTTGMLALINMPILQYASEMRTPTLIVAGENAHSRYMSEDAYKALGNKNKELYIVKGAVHTDLYDRLDKIPFDKFESFFKANLK